MATRDDDMGAAGRALIGRRIYVNATRVGATSRAPLIADLTRPGLDDCRVDPSRPERQQSPRPPLFYLPYQ